MALDLDLDLAPAGDIDAVKRHLKSLGYTTRVLLTDTAMARLGRMVSNDDRYRHTPVDELRYLEGLLDLPLGYVDDFGFVPAAGGEVCRCGREPSALDVVHTALRQGIHSKALIRDTMLGPDNVFEIAESGRSFACISCGNNNLMSVYHWRGSYMYA